MLLLCQSAKMDLSRMNIFKSVQIKIDTTKNGMYESTGKREVSIHMYMNQKYIQLQSCLTIWG